MLATVSESPHDVPGGLDFAFLDLARAEREDLQQRHRLLGLLVAFDVLYHDLGFAILGDDQGLSLPRQITHDFGSMGLKVTDGFDLA